MSDTADDALMDWKGFYEELAAESARGAVIIASAVLDVQLRELISKSLIDDPKIVGELLGADSKPDRPLSSFSSRIKAAYCLGLISKTVYSDLETIRKIRNKFAHKIHGYSFDQSEIVDQCKSLRLAKELSTAIPGLLDSHRNMFLVDVALLASWIAMRIVEVGETRRPAPADFDGWPVELKGGELGQASQ